MRKIVLMLAAASLFAASPGLSPTEESVVRLLNEARADPARFAERYLARHARKSSEAAECVREMRVTKALPVLKVAEALVRAAGDHADDSGRSGITGHRGSDRSSLDERISRYAKWEGRIAENIYYGRADAEEIVVQLLIDRGVPGRGHRRTILDPKLALTGVAIRSHPGYGSICVMDFATLLRPLLERRTR